MVFWGCEESVLRLSGSFTPRVYSKMRFLPLFRCFQALIGYGWYKLSSLVLIVPKMAYFGVKGERLCVLWR